MTRIIDSTTSLSIVLATVVLVMIGCSTPPDANQRLEQAHTAHQAERIDEARMLAQAAIELGHDTDRARQVLAAALRDRADEQFDQGLYRRAHQTYLDAADNEPSTRRRARDYTRAFESGRHFGLDNQSQLELAERALQFHSEPVELREHAARLAEDLADYETAVEHYLWLFTADSTDVRVGLRLGISYLAIDRPGDAAAVLQQMFDIKPDNVQIGLNLTRAYQQLDRPQAAVDIFDQLLEHHPQNPGVLRRYARLKQQLGEFERAEQLQRRATEASPSIEEREEMRPLR